MVPSNAQELIEELEATQERYVRKKLALGGYQPWEDKIVRHWLNDRETNRLEAEKRSKALWTKAMVAVTALPLFGAIVQFLLSRI